MTERDHPTCDCALHDASHGAVWWAEAGSTAPEPAFCDQPATVVFTRRRPGGGSRQTYSCDECFWGMILNYGSVWGRRGVKWRWASLDGSASRPNPRPEPRATTGALCECFHNTLKHEFTPLLDVDPPLGPCRFDATWRLAYSCANCPERHHFLLCDDCKVVHQRDFVEWMPEADPNPRFWPIGA